MWWEVIDHKENAGIGFYEKHHGGNSGSIMRSESMRSGRGGIQLFRRGWSDEAVRLNCTTGQQGGGTRNDNLSYSMSMRPGIMLMSCWRSPLVPSLNLLNILKLLNRSSETDWYGLTDQCKVLTMVTSSVPSHEVLKSVQCTKDTNSGQLQLSHGKKHCPHMWCDLRKSFWIRKCDIFSFLFNWSAHLERYMLLKTPPESDQWFQSYEQLEDSQNKAKGICSDFLCYISHNQCSLLLNDSARY